MAEGGRALVERAYAALDGDEIEDFIRLCDPSMTVIYPGAGDLPYGGTWNGLEAVARFLDLHDDTEEILDFEPGPMAVDGDTVFVQGFFRGRSKVSGRTWTTRWVHVFDAPAGGLRSWEAFFDTATAIAAHRT